MSTVAAPIRTRRRLEDPSCVKVVCDPFGGAMYFSRSPIPRAPGVGRRGADLSPPPLHAAHRALCLPS